jgi:type IV pilus assembly protein PilA
MSTAPHDVRGRWLFAPHLHRAGPSPIPNGGVATLELAAALAVTIVIVALAVSAYRTYVVRSEVRGTVMAVTPVLDLVTDSFKRTGAPPASESDLPPLAMSAVWHRSIGTLTIQHGRLEIDFGPNADETLRGTSLGLSPFETMDGEITWLCGYRPPAVGLYPLGLFGNALPAAQSLTTVDRRYLPPECR